MTDIRVITKPDFKKLKWNKLSNHEFAKHDSLCPISFHELPQALKSMPTGFIKTDTGFVLVAILGLTQNSNLYVNSENKWINRYLPVAYRTYPFLVVPIEEKKDELAFCLDYDSGLVTEGPAGEDFFGPDGELTPDLKTLLDYLRDNRLRLEATAKTTAAIAKLDLIRPWQIVTGSGEEQVNVDGLYTIDEKALLELSDEQFLELRHAGALPMIYCQLLSMRNIDGLQMLLRDSQNPNAENLKELDFNLHGDDGNLQFDV